MHEMHKRQIILSKSDTFSNCLQTVAEVAATRCHKTLVTATDTSQQQLQQRVH